MNDTYIIPEVYDEVRELPPDDDTAALAEENSRRKREGKADDIIAMQMALCLLIAAGLVILHIFRPELALGIFSRMRELSADATELFPNPIDLLAELINR